MARELVEQGFEIGLHITSSDAENDIKSGLNFLLESHDAIIIIGGLGPTSDDRTRYVLSDVIQKKLIFDEKCWKFIAARYEKMHLVPHENNKQQALFPEDATILPNSQGTASGCRVIHNNKLIYMLPGPPFECIPMFENHVITELLQYKSDSYFEKFTWRLMGTLESDIAAAVDAAAQEFPVISGYRVDYPYTHVKVYPQKASDLTPLFTKLATIFEPYRIHESNLSASELLRDLIIQSKQPIIIDDQATGGHLQTLLATQETFGKVTFASITLSADELSKETIYIKISGLDSYWQKLPPPCTSSITIQLNYQDKQQILEVPIPYRNQYVLRYAVEYAALTIWRLLTKLFNKN